MVAKKTGDKPAAPALNLAKLERENEPGDFVIVGKSGTRIQFLDTLEVDYEAFTIMDRSGTPFIEAILDEDNLKAFKAEKIPMWQVAQITQAYVAHFGVGSPGELEG
jgi:hypothetical protein